MVDTTYYTPKAAAGTLGVDIETVLGWIHSGELKASNVAQSPAGKRPRWRIAEAELGRFILRRQHPASAPKADTRARRPKPTKQYV